MKETRPDDFHLDICCQMHDPTDFRSFFVNTVVIH